MKKLLSLVVLVTASSAFAANAYTGASVGYLLDSEEAYFAGHIGVEVGKSASLLHGLELEVGYASDNESGISGDIVPVLANYRLKVQPASNALGFYAGAGIGASYIYLSGYGLSDSSWSFTAQGFAGLEYRAAPNVSLRAGARYLWIDDVKLFGYSAEVGDDVALEAGVSFRF